MMPRIRTIKPEFFLHDKLADIEALSLLPIRLAFIGLWCYCDREGRFPWNPKRLKAAILPFAGGDVMEKILFLLEEGGWIGRFASGGEEFGFVLNWKKHQVVNNKERASEILPPSVEAIEAAREKHRRGAKEIASLVAMALDGKAPPPRSEPAPAEPERMNGHPIAEEPKKGRKKAAKVEEEYSAGFLRFWEACPRKVKKGDTYDKWRRALELISKRGDEARGGMAASEWLLSKMLAFAEHHRSQGTEKEFIPHPSTWLFQKRYDDDDMGSGGVGSRPGSPRSKYEP